eukprot:TRINITY_DN66308_c0_g1_i1.p1 TRINITY_DN66308_c0_g1~~TRINITY_DN66308_c0_g1_i1.p1  ORF type:complete len:102 (-),score=0.72 TRINITY_DN66308_c0_g1_i1:104-409(-)
MWSTTHHSHVGKCSDGCSIQPVKLATTARMLAFTIQWWGGAATDVTFTRSCIEIMVLIRPAAPHDLGHQGDKRNWNTCMPPLRWERLISKQIEKQERRKET